MKELNRTMSKQRRKIEGHTQVREIGTMALKELRLQRQKEGWHHTKGNKLGVVVPEN